MQNLGSPKGMLLVVNQE